MEQILNYLSATGANIEPFYFRTGDGYEVDLVLVGSRERWAIKIKLTTTPTPADLASLARSADLFQSDRRILISQTTRCIEGPSGTSCDLSYFLNMLAKGDLPR